MERPHDDPDAGCGAYWNGQDRDGAGVERDGRTSAYAVAFVLMAVAGAAIVGALAVHIGNLINLARG